MSHKVNDKIGFGSSATKPYVIEITIDEDYYNGYDVFLAAEGGEYDITTGNGLVRVIIQNYITVFSFGSGEYGSLGWQSGFPAITRGTGWGAGWDVEILIPANAEVWIYGGGGLGGAGARYHSGTDHYIGPAGGSGAPNSWNAHGGGLHRVAYPFFSYPYADDGHAGSASSGGVAGVGRYENISGTYPATDGGDGADAILCPVAGQNIDLTVEAGATLHLWAGGGGGGGATIGGTAGAGGDRMQPGEDSDTQSGGAAGSVYAGSGTVIEHIYGTLDKDT